MTEVDQVQKESQAGLQQMYANIERQNEDIQRRKTAQSSRFAHAGGKDNLRFITITDPDALVTDPAVFATFGNVGEPLYGKDVIAAMYPLYEKSFPIDTERTSLEGLCDAMRVNKDPDLQSSNQQTQEGWVVAFDPNKKKVVGGYNTVTISTANADPVVKKEADAGSLLIYTFVDPNYRDKNLSNRLADVSEAAARDFAASTHNDGRSADKMMIIQAAEQNDPLALTAKDIIEDSKGAGIDQCDRRTIFNKNYKFGQIKFNYVQPGLEGGEPCEGLNLVMRKCPPPGSPESRVMDSVSPNMLKMILENFIEKSIFSDPAEYKQDQTWLNMKENLNQLISKGKSIFIDHDIDFQSLKPSIQKALHSVVYAANFSVAAYEEASMSDLGVQPAAKLSAKAENAGVAAAQKAPTQAAAAP